MDKMKMYHFVLGGVLLLIGNLRGTEAKIYVLSQETNETVRIIDDKNIRAMSVAIQGYVILANPPSACSVIDPPPNITNASTSDLANAFSISLMKHWILLTTMNGNDCDMTTKAKHAYHAGYSAIIVQSIGSNSSDGIYWYMMKFPVKRHSMINKVIVGEYDGDLLKYNYSFPKKYYIRFEEDYFYQYICYTVIGCIFVVLVFLLFIFWVQICCTIIRIAPRFIRYRMENLRQSWEKKLSKGMVDLIPIKTWNTEYQFQVCAICQEDFEENDELRLLPCRHGFHVPCIDPWLLHRSRRCPNCMQKIVVTKTSERKVIGVQCNSDSCDFNGDSYLEMDEDDPGMELLGTSSVRSQQEEPEIEKSDDSKIKKEQKEEGSVDWQLGWFLGGFKFVTSSQESMAVSPVNHAPNSSLRTVVSKTERSIELKDLSRSQSSKLPYTCSSFSLKNMYQYGEGYSNHLMTPGTTTLDLQLHRNKDSKNSDATTISESLPRDEVSCPGRLNLEGISDSDLKKYDENDDDAATIRPDFDDYYDYEDYEDDVFDESTSML